MCWMVVWEMMFSSADVVIVPHIYFVRDSEVEKTRVSAQDLVDRLEAKGTRALHVGSFDEIVEHLEMHCRPGDLVVTMGAGPVNKIAKDIRVNIRQFVSLIF